jgi:hypothetical protein
MPRKMQKRKSGFKSASLSNATRDIPLQKAASEIASTNKILGGKSAPASYAADQAKYVKGDVIRSAIVALFIFALMVVLYFVLR